MNEEQQKELERLSLEIQRLNTNIAKLRNALGTLTTWLQRDLGSAGVKQLLEMIE